MLIPMDGGGHRRICLTNGCWRLGTVKLGSVHPPQIVAGVSKRKMSRALERLLWEGVQSKHCQRSHRLISQNLAKCFDNVHINEAVAMAFRWGVLVEVLWLAHRFYSGRASPRWCFQCPSPESHHGHLACTSARQELLRDNGLFGRSELLIARSH